MAEIEEVKEASLNLQPDAWRYKTDSGYSITEGMEYELFTEKFRLLYSEIEEKEKQYTETVKTNIFLGKISIQTEDERIKDNLFTEIKKGSRRESIDTVTSKQELFIGMGLIVLLFFILVRFTFRRKKKTKHI